MTEKEQRIAISEWMGWTNIVTIPSGRILGFKPGAMKNIERDMTSHYDLPNYPHDLNALHEAEKKLTTPQSVAYERELDEVANADFVKGESVFVFPTWHATAAQRCEALCRTLWSERFEK